MSTTYQIRHSFAAGLRRAGTDVADIQDLYGHTLPETTMIRCVTGSFSLRPHRLARYMASTDPDFETKAADIIGLYLDPPRHAAVFCLDEKTAIQALDRRDRVLPLSPGRVERHGFEYKRHGTLSLYAALNIQTGDVVGKTTARHTSQDFVGFLGEVVVTCEPDQEIHVILDNLSAHKTKLVAAFLDEYPNVKLHFTPTYSSWLNQVELWFSKVQRDVLSRGIFTSTADLARKLRRYIKAYAKQAKPFRWKYSDPTRRIPHGKLTPKGCASPWPTTAPRRACWVQCCRPRSMGIRPRACRRPSPPTIARSGTSGKDTRWPRD